MPFFRRFQYLPGFFLGTVMFFLALFMVGPAIGQSVEGHYPSGPSSASLDSGLNTTDFFETIDPLIEKAIADSETPGAVVAIGRKGQFIVKAWGNRQILPSVEPMTVDTLFDLASITKVVSTALCVNILIDRGKLDFNGTIAKYMPEFGCNGKEKITVQQCLTHTSGLTPDNSMKDYDGLSQEEIWKNICRLPLRNSPGKKFSYSDVGFIVLGKLVERISGQSLDRFATENIYRPLGMTETGYNPGPDLRKKAAATGKRSPSDIQCLKGQVHDPRAFAMNGVAGHAGLFSTAPDLAILAFALLGHGTLTKPDGTSVTILSSNAFDRMNCPFVIGRNTRSYGWDKQSDYSRNRGRNMTSSAFGHGGFTGTSLWIDPELNLFVIFLATRLHPDEKGSVNALAGDIGTIAVEAVRK